jgi:hypothetical protein
MLDMIATESGERAVGRGWNRGMGGGASLEAAHSTAQFGKDFERASNSARAPWHKKELWSGSLQ